MLVYFDLSALVPLLVTEAGTPLARDLWESADEVTTSGLLYVEAAAALARARRMGRVTEAHHRQAVNALADLWRDFRVVGIDAVVTARAAELADRCGLRGYDAVHCACAERVDATDLVVAGDDKEVLAACGELALATALTGG